LKRLLGHPFWQTILVLIVAYVVIKFGIAWIPPLIGVRSAPAPSSVVLQYMVTAIVGMLLYVSADELRWRHFKQPVHDVMVEPRLRTLRMVLLVAIPLLVGFVAFDQVRPTVQAPPALRSIHPAPPGQITFQGRSLTLATLTNPLRSQGDLATHYEEGKRVYYQNCLPCHGDALDGAGHYAHGFSPTPLSFRDNGTIAQLTESFVFWRVAKGGVGLPKEGTPWNSAMPAWEDFLTENEIWAVIIFLYEQTGWHPRTMEEAGEGGHS
jgi:mono/diheme cytochrome c family protein